jgi:hypothetical protein
LSNEIEGLKKSSEYESGRSCDSSSLDETATFDHLLHSLGYGSAPDASQCDLHNLSNLVDLSDFVNLSGLMTSAGHEFAGSSKAGSFPNSNQLRISITRGSFWIPEPASVLTFTYLFAPSDTDSPELEAAGVSEMRSPNVAWIIIVVFVGISLVITGGIVFLKVHDSHTSSANETESDVEIPGDALSWLGDFETFLSEENRLTDDEVFSVRNEVNDAGPDEAIVL